MYTQVQLKNLMEGAIANLPYNTEAEKLIEPVKYVLSIGGKRLRPVIALMSCNLFSEKIDNALLPAAGIEVFHNFTLVHDDIMDNAPLRRNFPTVHNRWNLNQAVLSGDVMAFIANECFLRAPAGCMAEVFRIFNKAAIEVCIGQQEDMDFEQVASVTEKEYIRMIELKTAVLIAASARIGAVIGGADDQDAGLMYEFGRNLGLAFQLQDDLLDAFGDMKVFGKVKGGDIVANKKTFLFVKALEKASKPQRDQLLELFSGKTTDTEKKVREVMKLYEKLDIRQITSGIVKDYTARAYAYLERTGVPEERKGELAKLAEELTGREK